MRVNVVPTIFSAVNNYSATLRTMGRDTSAFEQRITSLGEKSFAVAKTSGAIGAAIMAPLAFAVKSAVDFEDKMADIAKTTGLAGKELADYGNALLAMKTRTSIDDRLKIGEIGGQLGVATSELNDFTKQANTFSIALAGDYAGGVEEAITSVGKLNNLFADTRKMDISQSISRAGSAINELGAVGAGTTQNLNDFALRMGAMPDALKPSLQVTLALGTAFEESGLKAERAASGFQQLMTGASANLPGFASQMKMTSAAAKQLFMQDPGAFAAKFSESLKGLDAEAAQKVFASLKISSAEEKSVIGILSNSTERLTTLRNLSSKSFEENISLSKEAAKKEDTLAAKMAIAKNNFQTLGIVVGTKLIPVVSSLATSIGDVITGVSGWIDRHPTLSGIIIKGTAVIGGLALAISGVNFAIGITTKILPAYTFVTGLAAAATGNLTGALLAQPAALAGATAGIRTMAFASMFLKMGLLGSVGAIAGVTAGLAILITGYKHGFDSLKDYAKEHEEIVNGMVQEEKAITQAEIALSKYNDAMRDFNEQKQFRAYMTNNMIKGGYEGIASTLFDAVKHPMLMQQYMFENMNAIAPEAPKAESFAGYDKKYFDSKNKGEMTITIKDPGGMVDSVSSSTGDNRSGSIQPKLMRTK